MRYGAYRPHKPTREQVRNALEWQAAMFGKSKGKDVNMTIGIGNGPTIGSATSLADKFLSASRMQDGQMLEGIVQSIQLIDFTEPDAAAPSVVARFTLAWRGEEWVFMSTPQLDAKIGGAGVGDYVCIRRDGTSRTRAGYSVVNFTAWMLKAGQGELSKELDRLGMLPNGFEKPALSESKRK